jgi:hypothetical protein
MVFKTGKSTRTGGRMVTSGNAYMPIPADRYGQLGKKHTVANKDPGKLLLKR